LLQEWADVLLHDADTAATLVVGRRRSEKRSPCRGNDVDATESLQVV
jgi:hypothetical protein